MISPARAPSSARSSGSCCPEPLCRTQASLPRGSILSTHHISPFVQDNIPGDPFGVRVPFPTLFLLLISLAGSSGTSPFACLVPAGELWLAVPPTPLAMAARFTSDEMEPKVAGLRLGRNVAFPFISALLFLCGGWGLCPPLLCSWGQGCGARVAAQNPLTASGFSRKKGLGFGWVQVCV